MKPFFFEPNIGFYGLMEIMLRFKGRQIVKLPINLWIFIVVLVFQFEGYYTAKGARAVIYAEWRYFLIELMISCFFLYIYFQWV